MTGARFSLPSTDLTLDAVSPVKQASLDALLWACLGSPGSCAQVRMALGHPESFTYKSDGHLGKDAQAWARLLGAKWKVDPSLSLITLAFTWGVFTWSLQKSSWTSYIVAQAARPWNCPVSPSLS